MSASNRLLLEALDRLGHGDLKVLDCSECRRVCARPESVTAELRAEGLLSLGGFIRGRPLCRACWGPGDEGEGHQQEAA